MKPKKCGRRVKEKIRRDQLKEMFSDEDRIEEAVEYAESHDSQKDIELINDVIRESRIDELFEDLGADENGLKKRKHIIKLNARQHNLHSSLFRKHDGKYQVETLLNEYHDSIFKEGENVGYAYGAKFFIKDIQSNRFSREDLLNMSDDEIQEYCEENREEI